MTNREWREELSAYLKGTDWIVDWSGLSQEFSMCLVDVCHRVTGDCQGFAVSWAVFATPATRKTEILRQLAE
jgi:hypothetical protein